MKNHLLKLSPSEFCVQTKACDEGRIFALKHKTMAEVWDNCPKVGWLLWILNAVDAPEDEKNLRLFAVWCARNTPLADGRTTGDLLTDPRSLAVLEVAERFANGEATRRELNAAWNAASRAARDAARDAAWAAARDAARDAAAWDAARDAASDAQSSQFKKMIANPFR